MITAELAYASSEERGPMCILSANEASDVLYRANHLSLRLFTENDIYLSDESPPAEDSRHPGITLFEAPKVNAAKSMLIVETFFLMKTAKDGDKVVYIGGSPGDHINALAAMFGKLTFDVYDPKPMPKIANTDNLAVFQEAFTNAHAEKYSTMTTLMISDIRNSAYRAVSVAMTNDDIKANAMMIVDDMESQRRWMTLMKPRYAFVRFRPLMKVESAALGLTSAEYPTGCHVLMPYAKVMTNSVMLITTPDSPVATYYHKDVISRLIWHNTVVRNSVVYKNPFTHSFDALLPIGEIVSSGVRADKGHAHYVMNAGWDMRTTFFVFGMFFRRKFPTISDSELRIKIVDFILTTFTRFENTETTHSPRPIADA